ncbi:phospho-N-acetylmuramoyl-pentapeptide-transferase [Candidatus Aerophobetes bacterium]|uniref:Phospho-N-acetylmuramoyl-pentapeptide-transferase n=1 Tax=Aerophobetes bacterium TaxID=2030807 RepID=A0A2A4X3L9_UNCAE|nr:MAG: phospho-N-acetylmuramoyl-pentapeptide-transferase [Candidatus Aerophobetes bacterium]
MILWLVDFLKEMGCNVPLAFYQYSTRMVLAAIFALVFTVLLGPWTIKKLGYLKTGSSVRVEDCPELAKIHEKKRNTPTMGGVLILTTLLFSMLLFMDLSNIFTKWFFFGAIFLGSLGGVDDYLKMKNKNSKGIASRFKFLFQLLFSAVFALYLFSSMPKQLDAKLVNKKPTTQILSKKLDVTTTTLYTTYFIPFKKAPFLKMGGVFMSLAFLITVCAVTGTSNAVNLSDGLDGLASGLLLPVVFVLALFAFLSNHLSIANYLNIVYIPGSGEIGVFLSALAGCVLGFLWFNGLPAEVFMGDTGSLALGGLIGMAAVMLRREILLILVGFVFVAEALSVILQVASFRLRKGKRIFRCAPLHHHFEMEGWPESKVVLRFWMVGFLFALISLASIKFQ